MSKDTRLPIQQSWERENFKLRETNKKLEAENTQLTKQVTDLETKNKEQAHTLLKLQKELDGLQNVI